MSKVYNGINIQFPISEEILSGKKIIETRTYPIPQKYLQTELLLIETPGKLAKFKSRARAIIIFEDCFKYKNKVEFYNDYDQHLVDRNSPWAWKDKPKYGWRVRVIKLFNNPKPVNKRLGIVYTKEIKI